MFLEYFKVKFIIKNLRLVKLLKFNKDFIVYLSMWYIDRPTLLISVFQTFIPQETLHKIPENSENYSPRKSRNLTFQKMENLPLYTNHINCVSVPPWFLLSDYVLLGT